MQFLVEQAGRTVRLTAPERIAVASPLRLTVAAGEANDQGCARDVVAHYWPERGVVTLREANGVERNLRVRSVELQRDGGTTLVVLELWTQGRMQRLSGTLAPDVPGQKERLSAAAAKERTIVSQITGKVLAVLVTPGTRVDVGAPLFVVEAMKMENRIFAPIAGTVVSIAIKAGDSVSTGRELARITP